MKVEINKNSTGLKIMLQNGNMLMLTPYLWNEFEWSKKKKRGFFIIGKEPWYWHLIRGHCEKNAKEFKKVIMDLYGIKVVS